MSARQFDGAIATYEALIPGTTDTKLKGDLWSRIGEAYRYKGDYPKSIEFMELATKALPENAAIATNLALLYEAGNNLPKARSNYERAIRIDQNNPLALNNLAYLITETNGDLTQAMTYATEAKQRLPNFLEVDDTIGWIYLKKNIPDSAVDEFKGLVAKAPQNPIYHYHYAMALNQKGDTVDAKAECEVALANRPQKPLEMQIRTLESSLK
jgi:tetratricopeptide (TPR) repeat protein